MSEPHKYMFSKKLICNFNNQKIFSLPKKVFNSVNLFDSVLFCYSLCFRRIHLAKFSLSNFDLFLNKINFSLLSLFGHTDSFSNLIKLHVFVCEITEPYQYQLGSKYKFETMTN